MRTYIRDFYQSSLFGYWLIRPFFIIYNYFRFSRYLTARTYIKKRFKRVLGYDLNLEAPKTFNEKLNWLMINYKKDVQTTMADKYLVRNYIKNTIGEDYLIPLINKFDNAWEITPESLPDYPFILKTNHDSSGGIIVRNKQSINWKKTKLTLHRLLQDNYYYNSKEWQYKNIKRCIVVEKLLMNNDGNIPSDYKLHCFNGKLEFVQVDLERQIEHKRNLYDKEWNFIPCKWKYDNGDKEEKPEAFEEMKNLAEFLSKDFSYLRVDFYYVNKKIYFGELTFHSEAGTGKFIPESFDVLFGQKLDISNLKN